jgi:hypothetical protein
MFGAALAGCIPPRWHRIQPGMNKDEVLHFVGEPRTRAYNGDFSNGSVETWYYDDYEPHTRDFQPHWVRFNHGRVEACESDPKRVAEVKQQKAETELARQRAKIIPPDVGFKCNDGAECASGKCIEHRCAGPRDCIHPAGDYCMASSDCCSMHCNFGARTCY